MHEKLKKVLDGEVLEKEINESDTTIEKAPVTTTEATNKKESEKPTTLVGTVKNLVNAFTADVEKTRTVQGLTTFVGYSMAFSDIKERLDLLNQFQRDFAKTISKREGVYLLARKELTDFSDKSIEQAVAEIVFEESKGFQESMTQEEKVEALTKLQKVLALEVTSLRNALKVYTKKDTRMAHSIDKYIIALKKDLAKIVKKRDDLYTKYNEHIYACETTTDLYDVLIELSTSYESSEAFNDVQKAAYAKAIALRDGITKLRPKLEKKVVVPPTAIDTDTEIDEMERPMSRVARRKQAKQQANVSENPQPTPELQPQQPLLVLPKHTSVPKKENESNVPNEPKMFVTLPPLPIVTTDESVAGTFIEVTKEAHYMEKLESKLPLLLSAATAVATTSTYVTPSEKHEGYLVIRYDDFRIKFATSNFDNYYIYKSGENLIAKGKIIVDLTADSAVEKIQELLDTLPTIWGVL